MEREDDDQAEDTGPVFYDDEDEDMDEDEDDSPKITTDSDYHESYMQRLVERRAGHAERSVAGIATGFKQLDAATGGLRGMTLLAGDTGSGRTSWALQVCLQAMRANPNLGVVYYILDDMSRDDIADQLVVSLAKIDFATYESGRLTADEEKRVARAESMLQKIRRRMRTITIQELNEQYAKSADLEAGTRPGLDALHLWNDCANHRDNTDVQNVLCVVDMFQNMPLPQFDRRKTERLLAEPDQFRLNQLVEYRQMTEEQCVGGWPILVLGQVRKEVRDRTEGFSLDDVLGPSDIKYKMSRILFLEPERVKGPSVGTTPTTLRLSKVRRGQRRGTIDTVFHYRQFRFEERASDCRSTDVPLENPASLNRTEGRGASRSGGLDRKKAL